MACATPSQRRWAASHRPRGRLAGLEHLQHRLPVEGDGGVALRGLDRVVIVVDLEHQLERTCFQRLVSGLRGVGGTVSSSVCAGPGGGISGAGLRKELSIKMFVQAVGFVIRDYFFAG